MKFIDLLDNQKLWSVVYDGDSVDILSKTLAEWMDPGFLAAFFTANIQDLAHYFHITNVDQAIFDTIADAATLSCLILDISPEANLDHLFRPLKTPESEKCCYPEKKRKQREQPTTRRG